MLNLNIMTMCAYLNAVYELLSWVRINNLVSKSCFSYCQHSKSVTLFTKNAEYLQFWLIQTPRGLLKIEFSMWTSWKKKRMENLWPEVKIRVWYPRETTMDISRQALKDVSVCCLKTSTASFSLTQKHQALRRLILNVGLCFISTSLVSNTMPGLFPKPSYIFRADRKQHLEILQDLSLFWTVFIVLISMKWPFARALNKVDRTTGCVFIQSNHQQLILIHPTGWEQL